MQLKIDSLIIHPLRRIDPRIGHHERVFLRWVDDIITARGGLE